MTSSSGQVGGVAGAECAITYAASARGPAASSRSSTLTPLKAMSNFDHVVTQWMSPKYVEPGSAWISSQVHVVRRLDEAVDA